MAYIAVGLPPPARTWQAPMSRVPDAVSNWMGPVLKRSGKVTRSSELSNASTTVAAMPGTCRPSHPGSSSTMEDSTPPAA